MFLRVSLVLSRILLHCNIAEECLVDNNKKLCELACIKVVDKNIILVYAVVRVNHVRSLFDQIHGVKMQSCHTKHYFDSIGIL